MARENKSFLNDNRNRITRNHIRTLTNLLKLGRIKEATMQNLRFTGILWEWENEDAMEREAAMKDGSAEQRKTLTANA